MQHVLHLKSSSLENIVAELSERVQQAPHFFAYTPLIVDCKLLDEEQQNDLDFSALKEHLTSSSFIPVGVRHAHQQLRDKISHAGLGILADSQTNADNQSNVKPKESSESPEQSQSRVTAVPAAKTTTVVSQPVRSGQQIFADNGDLVILTHTGAGSEVLASGSVHVYGKVGGRVLAGINGDTSARIFCRNLQAELIAIAGRYLLLDEADVALMGQPAMISLQDDSIHIEPLSV